MPSVALDAYCERCDIERLALLKVDVEGAEGRVLAGAQGLLARGAIDVLLIEVSDNTLEHASETARALLARLEEVGMRPHVIEDGRVRPFRVAGRLGTLANVIAAGPAGRRRLTRAAHAH